MIDASRWVISEAWVANGLRIEWGSRFGSDSEWFGERSNIRYVGGGVWEVRRPPEHAGRMLGDFDAPMMATADMRHELAHWLVASPDQRSRVNFGMVGKFAADSELEEHTLAAEKVIDSLCAAAGRIVTLALGSRS